ncbi:MAG: carbon storage regulator [Phycisphaerae bacterium]|nr:carbon storage regulator [Phycisphaerae bacterium]
MLILSRQINEKIKIGNDIEIVVVAIKGKKVRLGVNAPESIQIIRDDAKCHCSDPSKCGENCCGGRKNG